MVSLREEVYERRQPNLEPQIRLSVEFGTEDSCHVEKGKEQPASLRESAASADEREKILTLALLPGFRFGRGQA